MIIDTHGHYIAPDAISEIEKNPDRFGIRTEWDKEGNPCLKFGDGPLTRPLRPRLRELDERWELLRRRRIDLQFVYTWLDVVGYSLPLEKAAAWCRLQNETLAADIGGKEYLAGLATVPLQSGGRAATELAYAVEKLGLKGVAIASNVDGRNLDDREFESFWAQAESMGVPVVIHPYNVAGHERMTSYFLNNLVGNPLDTTLAAASLLLGGVADRYSNLKVVLVHGGGCLPFLIGRLQWGYERYPQLMGDGLKKKSLIQYLSWFYYDALLYHQDNIKHLIELVGIERVLMGSDYPFPIEDTDPVTTVEKLRLPVEDESMIFEKNPMSLFRL